MPNYEDDFRDRSEMGRGRGGDYVTPAGQPRKLSTSERARLLRSAGMQSETDVGRGSPEDPREYGIRIA